MGSGRGHGRNRGPMMHGLGEGSDLFGNVCRGRFKSNKQWEGWGEAGGEWTDKKRHSDQF